MVETDMIVKATQTVMMEQIETIVRQSRDAIFPLHSRVKEWLSRATFLLCLRFSLAWWRCPCVADRV